MDLSELAKRLYLSPSDKVLRDFSRYLNEIQEDLTLLGSIDVSSTDIYYGHKSIVIDSSAVKESDYEEESREDLQKLIDSYEFFNSKD